MISAFLVAMLAIATPADTCKCHGNHHSQGYKYKPRVKTSQLYVTRSADTTVRDRVIEKPIYIQHSTETVIERDCWLDRHKWIVIPAAIATGMILQHNLEDHDGTNILVTVHTNSGSSCPPKNDNPFPKKECPKKKGHK